EDLVWGAVVVGGGTCGTKPCWHAGSGANFKYKEKTGAADGVITVAEKIGPTGAGKLGVKGKGAGLVGRPLGLPALPLALPVQVQWQATTGAGWSPTYHPTGLVRSPAGPLHSQNHS